MKKFKNIIYIAILSLLVVSCEDNTDSITNPGTLATVPKEIKVGFTDDNTTAELQEGETTSFRIGMPAAIDGTVTVSISVSSSDGEVEAVFPTSITLEEGQSAVLFDVTPKDDAVSENETYTVEITDVQVNFNSDTEFFIHNGDISRTIAVKDIPTPIVTTVGDLTFNFTWAGAGNDLDCRLWDWPPTTEYDTGYSITPGESVTLPAGVPDGDYIFTVRPWTVVDTSIDYAIDVVAPTETRTYSGNFMNLTGNWTMEFIVLEINKTTSGTTVTYFITQP